MDKYKYYARINGVTREFHSVEDCANASGVSKWDVINGCNGTSKTEKYNNTFMRILQKQYDNTKFLRENPRNRNGEFILKNKIPGVTEEFENNGILVEHIPTESIYMNILDASDGTCVNAGIVLKALKNRGPQRDNFRVAFHDMTHNYPNGVMDMLWYSPTFDARKIDESNLGSSTDDILRNYLRDQKASGLTADQVMEDSPIAYYDIYGSRSSEFSSVMEASHFLRLHPSHILQVLTGFSPLNGRFQLL